MCSLFLARGIPLFLRNPPSPCPFSPLIIPSAPLSQEITQTPAGSQHVARDRSRLLPCLSNPLDSLISFAAALDVVYCMCMHTGVCDICLHSWCCKQAAILFLVMRRSKGTCVECPATTLQCSLWQLRTQFHCISACLMMMIPKHFSVQSATPQVVPLQRHRYR